MNTTTNQQEFEMNKQAATQLLAMLTGMMDAPVAVNRKRPAKGKNAKKTKKGAPKDEAAIEASRQRNNDLVIEAFTAAGYTDVQPRVNVLTYDKHLEQGRRVRKGEKSIRVGNFALFHASQCDPVDAPASTEANQEK